MPWQNFSSAIDGGPAEVRMDDRFLGLAPIADLPSLATFTVYCQQSSARWLVHPDEVASLDAVEETFIGVAQRFGKGAAVYVARVVTRGMRKYLVYFGPEAEMAQVLPALESAHPDYRIEFAETPDSSWEKYRSLLRNRV